MESIQELRADLHRFREIVGRGTLVSYSQGEKTSLLENSQRLLQRLDAVEGSVLAVGLLGGTGVGKSTLMNALAGAPIASTSHRRPHTERVLIYRHAELPLPVSPGGSLAWDEPDSRVRDVPATLGGSEVQGERKEVEGETHPVKHAGISTDAPDTSLKGPGTGVPSARDGLWMEVLHRADLIRHILLCDLPDFDSLVGEHRSRVIRFLENLDVLVWVASPEKYGDARFYSFLRQVPKARQNFYFVLNKVDLLFQGRTMEDGYGELGKVMARFTEHLVDNGMPEPFIFAVSADLARGSGGPAPWNQLPHFRHQIFQLRDAMEVSAIKMANLDVEVKRFLSVVEREILQLTRMREALDELGVELAGEREEWAEAGREAMELWLEGPFRKVVPELLMDPSHLVGPGYLVGRVAQLLRGWPGMSPFPESGDGLSIPREAAFLLQSQMERLENRIVRRLVHRGLSPSLEASPDAICTAGSLWEGFSQKAGQFMAMRVMDQSSSRPRGFRLIQTGAYLALSAIFLMAVAGGESWRDFIKVPGIGSLLDLAAQLLFALFSPRGLAALASYLILLLLLGVRFYSRYKKSLQQRAQKFIESLKLGLGNLWEEELQSVIQGLDQRKARVEAQVGELSSLCARAGKD